MNHIAGGMAEKMTDTLLTGLTKHVRIGLSGAQRTGKSTLAEHYSNLTGLPFVVSSVSSIMAEIGFDSTASYDKDFKTRLKAQFHLLKRLDEEWSKHEGGFITDRTPMCMAMYTLADIVGTTELDDDDVSALYDYIDQCKLLTLKHFNVLVNVAYNPRIELINKAGSAPAKKHHILHLETLLKSLIFEIKVPTGSDPRTLHDLCGEDDERSLLRRFDKPKSAPTATCLGRIENLVRLSLADIQQSKLIVADLPFEAGSVEERVQWLHSIVIREAFDWVSCGLAELGDSPLINDETAKLYKTIDIEHIKYA
tara:strand:- start:26439 stop:27368 length:930 start_codon:yes stop_codon:yes gene_type:complete